MEWVATPGHIVCFSQHGMKCLDQESGAEIWADHEDYGFGVVVTQRGSLLASRRAGLAHLSSTDQTRTDCVVELDPATGSAIRVIPTQLAPAAVSYHGILCRWLEIGGRFRTRIALTDEMGNQIWCEERAGDDRFQWTCPVTTESVLASYGSVVECRSLRDGCLRWSTSLEAYGGIMTPWGATLSRGVLVLVAAKGTVALDADDGHLLWFHPSVARATLVEDRCFLRGHRSLTVLNVTTGDTVWSRDVFSEMRMLRRTGTLCPLAAGPAASAGLLFVADQSGRVWVLNGRTGQVIDEERPHGIGVISGSPMLAIRDRLYLNDLSINAAAPSALHCFRINQVPLG